MAAESFTHSLLPSFYSRFLRFRRSRRRSGTSRRSWFGRFGPRWRTCVWRWTRRLRRSAPSCFGRSTSCRGSWRGSRRRVTSWRICSGRRRRTTCPRYGRTYCTAWRPRGRSWIYRVCRGMYHPGDPGSTKHAEVCTTQEILDLPSVPRYEHPGDPGSTEHSKVCSTHEILELPGVPRYVSPRRSWICQLSQGMYHPGDPGSTKHAEVCITQEILDLQSVLRYVSPRRSWIYWASWGMYHPGDPGSTKCPKVCITQEILDLPSVLRYVSPGRSWIYRTCQGMYQPGDPWIYWAFRGMYHHRDPGST